MRSRILITSLFALVIGCSSSTSAEDTGDSSPQDDGSSNDSTMANDSSTLDDASTDSSPSDSSSPLPDVSLDGAPSTSKTFSESTADFLNPERGWWDSEPLQLKASDDYSNIRTDGFTMVYAGPRLDAYRTTAIPDSVFTDWNAGFDKVRKAGFKVVLRFVYNDGPGGDASETQILAHIAQMKSKKLLENNADVIAVFEGGFIGQWGEWHDSTNGLDNATSRKHIMDAMLDALPASRMVQIRTPMYKADWYKTALTDAQAFDGSNQARIGHYNDCFLASDDDEGTYDTPIDTWKNYVAADTRFTPMGGQTCKLNPPRSECAVAKAEMAKLHWSYIDRGYLGTVIDSWKTGGCYDEISKHVGYRFSFADASFTTAVRPGGIVSLHLSIKNTGYSAPYNPRPVYAVLDDGTTKRMAVLGTLDARKWASGSTAVIDTHLRIPASMAAGKVKLALALPDAAASIANDSRFAIRFANDGVWDDTKGYNLITDALTIDASAPAPDGSVDPAAKDFVELK